MPRAKGGQTPTVKLPPALVERLVGLGIRTEPGRVVLDTLFDLTPGLKESVEQVKGALNVTCQGGTLTAADPSQGGE